MKLQMSWDSIRKEADECRIVAMLVLPGRIPSPELQQSADILAISSGKLCEVIPLTAAGERAYFDVFTKKKNEVLNSIEKVKSINKKH